MKSRRGAALGLSLTIALLLGAALAAGAFLDGGPLVVAGLVLGAAGILAGVLIAKNATAPAERLLQSIRVPDPTGPGDRPAADLSEVLGAFTGMRDALKQEASARARETEQLRGVLETMIEGVLVIDKDGRVILENEALRRLLASASPLVGRTAVETFRSPEFGTAVARVIAGSEPEALEIALGHAAGVGGSGDRGGPRVFGVTLASLPMDGGRGAVAVFHDVTRIRELEAVRRDFVANVSHELRTPLAAIKGYVETLRDNDVGPADRKRFLDTVARHTDRLSGLIEDLLELSRLESPHTRLDIRPLSLDSAAGRALQLVEGQASARGIDLRNEVPLELPTVIADARSLEQVFVNLVDNAIKWTGEGGRIVVSARQEGNRVRTVVSDTGAGIPPTDLPRLFERFYRVDRARTREQGGTGLGLAIVKRLVQMQGGDVGVESVVGQGSSFWFTLRTAPFEGNG